MQPRAGVVREPTASVVLCVRNGASTLARQLGALASQAVDDPWEVVLVDNASTDGTGAIAAAWREHMPWLRVVEEPRPGLNRARNRGVEAAVADRILCCDADDEVGSTWVRAMLHGLDRFDIVGGALEPRPNGRTDALLDCPQTVALPTLFDQEYAVGASLGFARSVHQAIDGFDEDFGTGADDVDFCLRAARAGFSIGFVRDATARYAFKDTPAQVMRQHFGYGRGYQRLAAKYECRGWIDSSPAERWKDLATNGASLVWTSPRMSRSDARLRYLARLAHVAGEATELVRPVRRRG